MLLFIVKRIFWFIPTLFIVTLIGFFLLAAAPGDPTTQLLSIQNNGTSSKLGGNIEIQKKQIRKQLGLDLPLFYFSLKQLSEPDTLYKIVNETELQTFKTLLYETGNANAISNYYQAIASSQQQFELIIKQKTDSFKLKHQPEINKIYVQLNELKTQSEFQRQYYTLSKIKYNLKSFYELLPVFIKDLDTSIFNLHTNITQYKNYVPKLTWYGLNNQYHHWLVGGANSKGILRGDFGISYVKNIPVNDMIADKIGWTLLFSILSIILAFGLSIPLGIKMSLKPTSRFTKRTQTILFLLYALPSFFIGVLLLMLFANPDVISILPPSGIMPIGGYNSDASFFTKLIETIPYMILPLICYTYSSIAFISKLTSTTIHEQLGLDYIQTAHAKGLDQKHIVWRHALKNSLLPLITVFTAIFPSIVGGSVIIESIFTIPGMGLETVKAIISQDYPFVIAVITISALATIISYIIADILYALVDPRIKLNAKRN